MNLTPQNDNNYNRLRVCWKDVMSLGWTTLEIACSDDNIKHHYHKMKSIMATENTEWLVGGEIKRFTGISGPKRSKLFPDHLSIAVTKWGGFIY